MNRPQKGRIASSSQKDYLISLTLNTRRGTLPKNLGQSSRYTFGSSDSARNFSSTNFVFEVLSSRSLNLSCDGTISMFTGSARCVASFKSAVEPHILKEKILQMNTRQSLTLSGPKNVGTQSAVVQTQETMLLNRTRRLKTLSGQESAGLESKVILTKEKLLQGGHVV